MSVIDISADTETRTHPVDIVEHVAALNDWAFERTAEDEISLSVEGRAADYQVTITWMDDLESLHLACSFDMKVPEPRRTEVLRLLALINERLWLGHFDIWAEAGAVMFRHSLLLSGGATASAAQCEALLGTGLDTVERFYPAFQFVVWAAKTAREAHDAVSFETVGEA